MGYNRRTAVASLLASALAARIGAQGIPGQADEDHHTPPLDEPDEDKKLPNGKSQKDAIATSEHVEAMKDAERLVGLATEIRDELQKAGSFTVPLGTLHKTEEIEKLARKIRGRLKV